MNGPSRTPRALELEILSRARTWHGLAPGSAKDGAREALEEALDEYERLVREQEGRP